MQFRTRPEGILQEYPAFRWLNIPSAMAVVHVQGESCGLSLTDAGGPTNCVPQDVSP